MGRARTGKTSIGEIRVKRGNGDVYVYERELAYNPETRKTFTVRKCLLGKIPAGQHEIVPTRPKKAVGVNKEPRVNANKLRIGALEILQWIGERSGIRQALSSCFDEGDALKIETIAQYWLMTNGAELSGLEAWQLCHRAPYADGISEQTYSRLFNDIALNESAVQQYFMTRAGTPTGKRKVLAVDSSTVDTYGAGQIEARHGFSKESNNLPSVKLLTIMEVNSLQPLAFHAQPGNMPGVLSIKNTLKQLDCLMEKTPLVVTDCGFTSEENLLDFVRHSIPTLTRMKLSTSWIREAFDEIKEEITKHANACPFDTFTFGVTKTVKHEFQILRQRTRGQYRAGDVQILPRNLHIHFFYDDEKATSDRAAFRSELKQLKNLVENGETLNKAGQRKMERFFFVKETTKGKVVEFNDEAIHEYQMGHGFFVLISNTEKDTWEALRYYRLREKIRGAVRGAEALDRGAPSPSLGAGAVTRTAVRAVCRTRLLLLLPQRAQEAQGTPGG